MEVRFFKHPIRPAITEVSEEWLESVGSALNAQHAVDRAKVVSSILEAQRLNKQRISHPLQGGLPGSNRRH